MQVNCENEMKWNKEMIVAVMYTTKHLSQFSIGFVAHWGKASHSQREGRELKSRQNLENFVRA